MSKIQYFIQLLNGTRERFTSSFKLPVGIASAALYS